MNVIYKRDKPNEAEDLCDVETAKWVNLLNGQDSMRTNRAISPKSFERKNNRRSPLLVSTSSPSVSSSTSFAQHYSPYSAWSTLDDSHYKHQMLSQLSPNAKEFTSSRKQPQRPRSPRPVSDFSAFSGVQSWNLTTPQEIFGISDTLKSNPLVTSNSFFDFFNCNHLSPYKGNAYSSQLPIAMA